MIPENIKEKVLKEEFTKLHLRCVEETKKLGRATYVTHGKRCEALGRFDEYMKTLAEVGKVIDDMITYPMTMDAETKLEELKQKLGIK